MNFGESISSNGSSRRCCRRLRLERPNLLVNRNYSTVNKRTIIENIKERRPNCRTKQVSKKLAVVLAVVLLTINNICVASTTNITTMFRFSTTTAAVAWSAAMSTFVSKRVTALLTIQSRAAARSMLNQKWRAPASGTLGGTAVRGGDDGSQGRMHTSTVTSHVTAPSLFSHNNLQNKKQHQQGGVWKLDYRSEGLSSDDIQHTGADCITETAKEQSLFSMTAMFFRRTLLLSSLPPSLSPLVHSSDRVVRKVFHTAHNTAINSQESFDFPTKGSSSRSSSAKSVGILESLIKENSRHFGRKRPIRSVDELRSAILDDQLKLRETKIVDYVQSSPTSITESKTSNANYQNNPFQDRGVVKLMAERYNSGSTPGHRHNGDNSTLALAIEGGGMRGCVSAGMAAAVAALGLTDTIDVVYGSSAGSVIGAYLVSRQVCMDVYVDILPAAKKRFVCKRRMARSIGTSLIEVMVRGMRRAPNFRHQIKHFPGMNISFVLDGIMGQDHGIRPLDMTKFEQNNKHQPLKVVSSCIEPTTGKLFSKTFGADDFFGETAVSKSDGSRQGLFACLEASMSVPGATGPPVDLLIGLQENDDLMSPSSTISCFDAFCFEPIPYRSAVEEGATHVLALCSRPEGYKMKTKPGLYESAVAPLYFHSHNHSKVADFFEMGGQQYVYAEDLLTFEQAKSVSSDEGVLIPPPTILYGVPRTNEIEETISSRASTWNRAQLMAIKVPQGTDELSTLEQDKSAVLEAVRGGFAAAFDSLSSIVGMEHVNGDHAASLLFPDDDAGGESPLMRDQVILETKLHVPGEPIVDNSESVNPLWPRLHISPNSKYSLEFKDVRKLDPSISLLASLPGFKNGKFRHLMTGGLRVENGTNDLSLVSHR